MPNILAIESSCDDTSAAVLRDDRLLSNVIASQKVHEQYGGVVPELASRAHQQNIVPVVDAALHNAGIERGDIDAVAFTRGPGLLGSLLVGVSFAKSFAQALQIPLIEVNHLQAHILAHFIKRDDTYTPPRFPLLCLLVMLFVFDLPGGQYSSLRHFLLDFFGHLTFTHNLTYEGYIGTRLNGVLWTLAVEGQFYLIAPLL